eukprot:8670544-Karenia_brevis.AAC.1
MQHTQQVAAQATEPKPTRQAECLAVVPRPVQPPVDVEAESLISFIPGKSSTVTLEEEVVEGMEPTAQTQSASASAEVEAPAEVSRATPALPTTMVPSAPPPSLPGWTTLVPDT